MFRVLAYASACALALMVASSVYADTVAITSGVWPDAVTSIEPVYWGVGNNLFAFLVTYHEHGEQKHPTAAWIKELIEHPTEVLSFDDALKTAVSGG